MCHYHSLTDEQQITLFRMPADRQRLLIHELEMVMDSQRVRNTRANAPKIQSAFEALLRRLVEPAAISA